MFLCVDVCLCILIFMQTDMFASASNPQPDYSVGPLPAEMSRGGDYDVSADFERRAERMKKQLTSSNVSIPLFLSLLVH